jgi:hypothetical protein
MAAQRGCSDTTRIVADETMHPKRKSRRSRPVREAFSRMILDQLQPTIQHENLDLARALGTYPQHN